LEIAKAQCALELTESEIAYCVGVAGGKRHQTALIELLGDLKKRGYL
jgi:hypothetical protein